VSDNTRATVLRFAAGSPANVRSSVWKLWTHRDDAYLLTRASGQWLKVSLHASGDWRIAYTRGTTLNDAQRVIHRWRRPAEMQPGWVKSLAIVVPFPTVSEPLDHYEVEPGVDIEWFPEPRLNRKLTFRIIFGGATASTTMLEATLPVGATLKGPLEKANGERVFVAAWEEDLSSAETLILRDHVAKTIIHLAKGSTGRTLYACLHAIDTDADQPGIIDIILGRENLAIAE
jgi:hypothetical protein